MSAQVLAVPSLRQRVHDVEHTGIWGAPSVFLYGDIRKGGERGVVGHVARTSGGYSNSQQLPFRHFTLSLIHI